MNGNQNPVIAGIRVSWATKGDFPFNRKRIIASRAARTLWKSLITGGKGPDMQSRSQGFVTLDNRKVKVQQWDLFDDRAILTILAYGESAGAELLHTLRGPAISLGWDDNAHVIVRPEITHHRAAGSGPTTLHRIEVALWFTENAPAATPPGSGDRLDQILDELRLLRAEVAELRAQNRVPANREPLTAGQTLLDFDIDTDDHR